MLTGIVHWLRLGTGATEKTPRAGSCSFEPLEPRVLLNADLAGVQPVLTDEAAPAGQAIHVDRNEQVPAQPQESAPLLTLEASPGTTYRGGTDGLLAGPLDLQETTPPTIDSIGVSPTSVPLGGSFLFNYTVSDSGGSGLSSVELRRSNDLNTWQFIAQNSAVGDGPVTGYLSDIPPAQGDWWYRIQVFDAALNSTTQTPPLYVVAGPDTTPPSPDPSTWATAPYATGADSIRMVATVATDVSGVEYYFREVSDGAGATDSGWQDSNVYEDTGLLPSTTYTYQVMTRDKSPNQNQTQPVEPSSATTLADTTPPAPSPSTWAATPYATGTHSIRMVATTADDVSGVEYYFDEISGNPGATDSDWQDSNMYEDTGLAPGMLYIYQVKTRDRSANHNEGAYSASASAATPSAVYRFWKAADNAHFFTIKESEKQKLIANYSHIYTYEGVAYYAFVKDLPPAGTLPVHRFWKASDNTHFYTIKESEKQKLIDDYAHVYTYEGPAFYAYSTGQYPVNTLPVYRFWKPQGNTHFFTIKESEKDKLINLFSHVYTFENAVWYAFPA